MRAHNTFHKTAGVLSDYDLRQGAEFIGGTIPKAKPVVLRDRLDRLADGAGVMHMTLSLPEGLRASREIWHAIVMAQLDMTGLPALRAPWIAARHTDANCDHVHVAIGLRGFDGSSLHPKTGDIRTSRNHQTLARLLGLPVPDYFNPQVPQLDPPVISRRLTTEPRKRLSAVLGAIFTSDRPRTLDALDDALARQSPVILRTTIRNVYGRKTHLFSVDGVQLLGGELGPAWEPRHLERRMAHAHALHRLRLRLSAQAILKTLLPHTKPLMEFEHAKDDVLLGPAPGPRGIAENVANDGRQSGSASAADQPVGRPRSPDVRAWRSSDRGSSAYLGGSAASNEPPGRAPHSPEPSERDHRRVVRDPRAARERTPRNPDREPHLEAENLGDPRLDVQPGGLTFGSQLVQLLRFLRARFSGWRWRRSNTSSVQVTFRDGSVAEICGGMLMNAPEEGEVTRFADTWHQEVGDGELEVPGVSDNQTPAPM